MVNLLEMGDLDQQLRVLHITLSFQALLIGYCSVSCCCIVKCIVAGLQLVISSLSSLVLLLVLLLFLS